MFLREVFFALCLLCAATLQAWAGGEVQVSGSVSPQLSSETWQLSFRHAVGNWSFFSQAAALRENTRIYEPFLTGEISWKHPHAALQLLKGRPHITDPSVFRIVNKNHVADDSLVLLVRLKSAALGMFSRLPLKDRLAGGTVFLVEHGAGPLEFVGMHLNYDTGYGPELQRRAGRIAIGQIDGRIHSLTATAAAGWHWSCGDLSKGFYGSAAHEQAGFSLGVEVLRIEPGFESLFASTNRLTPNRQGFAAFLAHERDGVRFEVNGRVHRNVAGSRSYPRVTVKTALQQVNLTAELRLLPTEAFVVSWKGKSAQWQVDVVRQWLRIDWQAKGLDNRFSVDYPGRIVRWQSTFDLGCEWRIVSKRDFARNLNHFSARVRLQRKGGFLQLEWGEYDRGNLRAGFSQVPTWRISWEWKF